MVKEAVNTKESPLAEAPNGEVGKPVDTTLIMRAALARVVF